MQEFLPIKERCDLEFLPEAIAAEIKLGRKKVSIVLSYQHPNLSNDVLVVYVSLWENIYNILRFHCSGKVIQKILRFLFYAGILMLDIPLFWEGDSENHEGGLLNNLSMSIHLEQLRDDGSQSCIDLICTDQPFTFRESGVLSSLDPHSKHNIIHGSANVSIPRSPPYKLKIYDYKIAKTDQFRENLLNLNWHDLFFNLNGHEKALVFSDIVLDIMVKHIPNKSITCNDSGAPWMTPSVKTAIKRNSRVYRKWVNRGKNPLDHDKVREVRNSTNKLIKEAKLTYHTNLPGEQAFRP